MRSGRAGGPGGDVVRGRDKAGRYELGEPRRPGAVRRASSVFGRRVFLWLGEAVRQAEHPGQARDAGLEGKARQGLGLGLQPVGEGPVERLPVGEVGVDADGGGEGRAQILLAGLDAAARLELRLAGEPAAQGERQPHGPAHAVEGDEMDGRITPLGLDRLGPPGCGPGALHGELGELRQHGEIVDIGGRVHEQKENMEWAVCQAFRGARWEATTAFDA
jgi:hypothetical protein